MPYGLLMDDITAGTRVLVTDALGDQLERRAVTGVVTANGHQFVWVCKEAEWGAAKAEEREPDAVPWPAEDVQIEGTAASTAKVAIG